MLDPIFSTSTHTDLTLKPASQQAFLEVSCEDQCEQKIHVVQIGKSLEDSHVFFCIFCAQVSPKTTQNSCGLQERHLLGTHCHHKEQTAHMGHQVKQLA